MRYIKSCFITLSLLIMMVAGAEQAYWQDFLKYNDLPCPTQGQCFTQPNPPCPAGVGCDPSWDKRSCVAPSQPGGRNICAAGETCCGIPPDQQDHYSCIATSAAISDCCIVGGSYCTGGRVCDYENYTDTQGQKHVLFVGCVNPSEKNKKTTG